MFLQFNFGTTLLVDNVDPVRRGGTGTVVDWTQAAIAAMTRRIVLAGGLTPDNVSQCTQGDLVPLGEQFRGPPDRRGELERAFLWTAIPAWD